MNILISKMRQSVYDIPKEYFPLTMSNLIEFQQPDIAKKFVPIAKEALKNKTIEEEFEKASD